MLCQYVFFLWLLLGVIHYITVVGLNGYYFVVEDFNEYPYSVWNVTTTRGTGEIQFK